MTKTRGWLIPKHSHEELILRIEKHFSKNKKQSSRSNIHDVIYKYYQTIINEKESNPQNIQIPFHFSQTTYKDLKYRKIFSSSYKIDSYNVLTHFLEKSNFIDWCKKNNLPEPTKANGAEDTSVHHGTRKNEITKPIGEYYFYFTGTSEPKKGLNFSADYELITESDSATFRHLKPDSSRMFKAEKPKYISGNVFYEFTDDSAKLERVYLILRVGDNTAKDYLLGLYLASNKEDFYPVSGPALLVKKEKDKDKKIVESFFAHYKFRKAEIITGINLKDVEDSLAKYNKLKTLCGFWRIIRWNKPKNKYSFYFLTIKDNLEVICETDSNTFQCSINVIGNNRIIIDGLNKHKDIMIFFTAHINTNDIWGKLQNFRATYKRISPDNIRYGDCIFTNTNQRSKKATRLGESQLNSEEKRTIKLISKKSYSMGIGGKSLK